MESQLDEFMWTGRGWERRCMASNALQAKQCRAYALKGSRYCHAHQEYDPRYEKYRWIVDRAGVDLMSVARVMDVLADEMFC